MSSNEASSWMSMGLIPSSLGVTTTLSECCNDFLSWWNCASTESVDEEEEEVESLAEPLVPQEASAGSERIDDRISNIESDLFLDEYDEDQPIKSVETQGGADIKNALGTDGGNDTVHSRAYVSTDEDDQDLIESVPLVADVPSQDFLDMEQAIPNESESIPFQSDVFVDEEPPPQEETFPISQASFQDTNEESQFTPPMEKNSSSQPLDCENLLLATIEDEESQKQKQKSFQENVHEQHILPMETHSSQPLDTENVLTTMEGECTQDYGTNPTVRDELRSSWREPQSTLQMQQSPLQNEQHKEHILSFQNSSQQPLDIENVLAMMEDECDQHPATLLSSCDKEERVAPCLIFRSHTPESAGNDQEVPAVQSLQMEQHDSKDDTSTPASVCDQDTTKMDVRESMEHGLLEDVPKVGGSMSTPTKSGGDQDALELDARESLQMKHDTFEDEPKVDGTTGILPESGDDQDATKIDDHESLHVKHNTLENEPNVDRSMSNLSTDSTITSTGSQVKKRVSDLIGIFESISMDEGENATPTSLCSSSSFSGPKPAHDICPCCHQKIYPTDATIAYHDKLFHGGCFKCHLCDRKFSRGLSEVAGFATNEEDSTCMLTCIKCRDDAAIKHLPLRKSTPACQPITVTSPEKGNIQQVKDEIGDDLESVMDGMIPRCAICGIHFLGTGEESSDMMIVGMNKYHRKCRMYGKPMVERSERKVLPIVAANYAPESLVVRISNTVSADTADDDTTKQEEVMTTLYFILPDKATDLQRIRSAERPNENVRFEYVMDSSAYANPNYEGTKKNAKTTFPCHGLAEGSLSVGFLGDPVGLPIQLADTRIEEDRKSGALLFCAELECFKFQLRHRFDLVMDKTRELVDLKTATLSMNIS